MNNGSVSTKERILKVTAKIISEQGMDAASTRAVCEKSGIKAPTLYYHFQDKSGLMEAVMSYAFEKHTLSAGLPKIDEGEPLQRIERAWDDYIDFVLAERELFGTMILCLSQGKVLKIADKCFGDLIKEFRKLEEKLQLNEDPSTCASIYISAAQGLGLHYFSLGDEGKILALSKKMRKIVLSGLGVNE